MVKRLGLGVNCLGFRIKDLWFGGQGRDSKPRTKCLGFRVWDFDFEV